MDVMVGCELCGTLLNLQRCSNCKTAFYCSKEHQKAHWRQHQIICEQVSATILTLTRSIDHSPNPCTSTGDIVNNDAGQPLSFANNLPVDNYLEFMTSQNITLDQRAETGANDDLPSLLSFGSWSDRLCTEQYMPSSAVSNGIGERTTSPLANSTVPLTNSTVSLINSTVPLTNSTVSLINSTVPLINSTAPLINSTVSSINSTVPLTNSTVPSSMSQIFGPQEKKHELASGSTYQDTGCASGSTEANKKIKLGDPEIVPFQHRNMRLAREDVQQSTMDSLVAVMANYIINDMDKYGICVIDDFLGKTLGLKILSEVKEMHNSGHFEDGQLMTPPIGNSSTDIRGDKTLWVNGNEEHVVNISVMIKLVDMIIHRCQITPNNGKMGNHKIIDRTKAMIACYPGCGTQYVKHVDNPSKDGRCITSIYYLNENWDVKKDGGLLRIFPTDWASQVANIEPLFDRILFFWSDRRNPHEVQPALRTRYAITLWYYDIHEKMAYHKRELSPASPSTSPDI